MQLCFWIALLLAIGSCDGYFNFVETDKNVALTEKIAAFNDIMHNVIEKNYVVRAVKAVASLDPTVANLLATTQGVETGLFYCFREHYAKLNDATSTTNLIVLLIKACPNYKSQINSIANATKASKTAFDKAFPTFDLTPGLRKLFNSIINCLMTVNNEYYQGTNITFVDSMIKDFATQINNLSTSDRDLVVQSVPWTANYIRSDGKYANSLRNTINAVKTGVRLPLNTTALAPSLTKLTLGLAKDMLPIAKWVNKTIKKLPVTATVEKNNSISKLANTLGELANYFGLQGLAGIEVQRMLQVLLGQRFYFTNEKPNYYSYYNN